MNIIFFFNQLLKWHSEATFDLTFNWDDIDKKNIKKCTGQDMIKMHLCAERKEVDEPIFLCKWPFWKCSDISTHTQMFNLAHISLRPPLLYYVTM